MTHPGKRFRHLVSTEAPLQIVGTINAYHAILAKHAGHQAIYLSGGGLAASMGMPDLGITTLEDVLIDIRRITDICDLPLLVDVDTGFGPSAFNIARTTKAVIKAGAAAMHIEDQAGVKRCGHRPNKSLATSEEMCDRIKAAVDARNHPDFVIMARTDAIASEGINQALDRALQYLEAGADMIFAEAVTELKDYERFAETLNCPILANITEFGMTELYTKETLAQAKVSMILYPLSAFRAMNAAALNVYQTIKQKGTQQSCINQMQTREQLYHYLNYHDYENILDQLNQTQHSTKT